MFPKINSAGQGLMVSYESFALNIDGVVEGVVSAGVTEGR